MVAGLLKLVFILCTIAVVGLSVVDTLWFNAMPESNRYRMYRRLMWLHCGS